MLNQVDLTANSTVVNEYFSLTDATHIFENSGIEGNVKKVTNKSGTELAVTAIGNGFTVTQEAFLAAGFTVANFNNGNKEILFVETDEGVYTIQVMLASFAIRNATDLRVWPSKIRPSTWVNNAANSYNGYVVLANNIDFGGAGYNKNELYHGAAAADNAYARPETVAGYATYFYGTFDGQGHTISNILINCGLFGTQFTGNIKDIGFVNVRMQNNWCGIFAHKNDSRGVVSNVFVSGALFETLTKDFGMLFGLNYAATNFNNVVVVYDTTIDRPLLSTTVGSLLGKAANANVQNVNNCIAISPICLYRDSTGAEKGTVYASMDAYNAANVNLSSFTSACWDVTSGFPVFKSAK